MNRQGDTPCESQFLKDVAEHRMTVLRDDGLHRHLQFRKPGTWCMGFEIVTFPGALVYSGDMGCYVFRRLDDMFEFFRTDRTHGQKDGRTLYINRQYWSEKCVAADRDGIMKYTPERFREAVKHWLDSAEASRAVRKAVAEDVLPYADDGEHEARRAVAEFDRHGFSFHDFWEADLRDYTYRFTWCCYALAWAVLKYDESKVPA